MIVGNTMVTTSFTCVGSVYTGITLVLEKSGGQKGGGIPGLTPDTHAKPDPIVEVTLFHKPTFLEKKWYTYVIHAK